MIDVIDTLADILSECGQFFANPCDGTDGEFLRAAKFVRERLAKRGIILMPVEPTEEMMGAAYRPDYFEFARKTYAAMRTKNPFEANGSE